MKRTKGGEDGGRKSEMERDTSLYSERYNSCLLLKLPSENGLRWLARNLLKFPERVIYSLISTVSFHFE